jgi:hypothetical protein
LASQQSDWRTILVQAQLVDARGTRPFPFPPKVKGRQRHTMGFGPSTLIAIIVEDSDVTSHFKLSCDAC